MLHVVVHPSIKSVSSALFHSALPSEETAPKCPSAFLPWEAAGSSSRVQGSPRARPHGCPLVASSALLPRGQKDAQARQIRCSLSSTRNTQTLLTLEAAQARAQGVKLLQLAGCELSEPGSKGPGGAEPCCAAGGGGRAGSSWLCSKRCSRVCSQAVVKQVKSGCSAEKGLGFLPLPTGSVGLLFVCVVSERVLCVTPAPIPL